MMTADKKKMPANIVSKELDCSQENILEKGGTGVH